MDKPICFVLMPFGKKKGANGYDIDFDEIYKNIIQPSIESVGLEPLRADEELGGGIIHKPMLESLLLCEYAIADLTTANANVFYELGIRHAAKPYSTILIYADNGRLPFDVQPLRAQPYDLDDYGKIVNIQDEKDKLTKRLHYAVNESTGKEKGFIDSPLYQLVDDYPNIKHEKTDVFRQRVAYSKEIKNRLAVARRSKDPLKIEEIENELNLANIEGGVIVDLLLSYRAVKAWDNMVNLVNKMPKPLANTTLVQEQLGFALNRANKSDEAEDVLKEIISTKGPSSETYGLLGRVYKDRWKQAKANGEKFLAEGFLDKAIDAYVKGFETDWRDAFPGINALTLMSCKNEPSEKFKKLFPVVHYSVERRIDGSPDYWDYATMLELAVLQNDEQKANAYFTKSLSSVREGWEPESTADNLILIYDARLSKGMSDTWLEEIIEHLKKYGK